MCVFFFHSNCNVGNLSAIEEHEQKMSRNLQITLEDWEFFKEAVEVAPLELNNFVKWIKGNSLVNGRD